MMEPETSNFFGNELDKAKLEIVSYWKDKYEKTHKALEIAVNAMKEINKNAFLTDYAQSVLDKALKQITALEQKD